MNCLRCGGPLHDRRRRYCSQACTQPPVLDRFWKRVQVGGPDECWPWTGELNNQGYGRFVISYEPRRRALGHRFSYELATGEAIAGLFVLHSCDNPPCVNPAHLRTGTQKDNMADAKERGRMNMSGLEIGWKPAKCGTPSGYTRHSRLREPQCEPCRQAQSEYYRAYYRRRRGAA